MDNLDLNDYYYDDDAFEYMADNEDFDYTEPIYPGSYDFKAVFETCIFPSVQQVSSYIFILLAACLIARLLWFISARLFKKGEWLQHWISLICGSAALLTSTGNSFWIIIMLSFLSYSVLKVILHFESKKNSQTKNAGVIVGVTTVAINVVCELASNTMYDWNSIRGIQIVIAMKVISLAFDAEDENKGKQQSTNIPPIVPFLGYVFCPANCLHGPWMPFNVHVRLMQKSANGLVQGIVWTFSNALLALGTVSVSNCFTPFICGDRSYKLIRAYRDALTVRTSHYFISFLSQATLAACGLSWSPSIAPNKLLGNVVTKPWKIEFPRSLSTVVRNWNLPMHAWLKIYVFRKVQTRTSNYLVAVFVTYLASSLLHGLYYQIHAVLFSLACFAYVEYVLRKKLAIIFDACIASTPCKKPCAYNNCCKQFVGWTSTSTWLVLAFNIAFGFLAIFHLAYLGVMLSTNEDGKVSFKDSIARWRQLNYFSHWTVVATFIFHCFV